MKRSEAIAKIKEKWTGKLIDRNNWAEQIIEIAESIGMKPPFSNAVFQRNAKIYIDPSGLEWDDEQFNIKRD